MQCNKLNVSFNSLHSEHLEQAIDIMTLLLLSPVVTCSGFYVNPHDCILYMLVFCDQY